MPHVLRRRRLANRRHRNKRRSGMSEKQIKFFGTPKQKAALRARNKRRRHRTTNRKRRATTNRGGVHLSPFRRKRRTNRKRRVNVGHILTVLPAGNPGRKRRKNRSMARTRNYRRRRHNRSHHRTYNRRRHNRRTYNRRHRAPVMMNRRRHNRRRRHHYYPVHNRRRRHNQGGAVSRDIANALYVVGGLVGTGMITGFLPSTLTTGWIGMVTTGVSALVLGQVAGKITKNKALGTYVTVGGMAIVVIQLMQQIFPAMSIPICGSAGTHGMGLLTSSNFYVPQVNVNGSMASFYNPASIPVAAPVVVPASGMNGLGQATQPIIGLRTMRRVGRLR